jgi:putative NIF3 family GTP cyclohydrolase 1 type 2
MRPLYFLFLISIGISACQPSNTTKDQSNAQFANLKKPTAGELVERIKTNVTCDWAEETVDTFKGGTADQEVSGIATTFLATMDVLKKAKAKGINFIITHEPTFYNHFDETEQFEGDAVVAEKQKYIKENGLIVWRFHDHIHRTAPDGIYEGIINDLGWKANQKNKDEVVFQFEQQSLEAFAKQLKQHYGASSIRVVGPPDMTFQNAALVLGAPGSMPQIKMLQREDVEVLVGGETHEWETVEYVRDAISQGKNKALILIGHANSEEAGMFYCAEWLKGFIDEIPIEFIPAGDPFWSPN